MAVHHARVAAAVQVVLVADAQVAVVATTAALARVAGLTSLRGIVAAAGIQVMSRQHLLVLAPRSTPTN